MKRIGGYWNKSRAEFRYRCQTTDHRLGQSAKWSYEQIAFLMARYPTDMALNAIGKETRHHLYEVKRKAEQLGLVRSVTAPSLNPAIRGQAFVNVGIETVVEWLRACGHSVTDGVFSGTYKMSHNDSMTPQQVVRFANDRRVRCGPEAC